MTGVIDLSQIAVLYPDFSGPVCITSDGEISRPSHRAAARLAADAPVLLCHRVWSEKRLGLAFEQPLDLLELYAFIRPAQICLPTPTGLAGRLGLARPRSAEDQVMVMAEAADRLLDEIDEMTDEQKQALAGLAEMMRRGGWQWAPLILLRLGITQGSAAPPDGSAASVWRQMEEIADSPHRPVGGTVPVMPDAARQRLTEMLGGQAEARQSQSDYAAATAAIFASPESGPTPVMLLSEAGTGTGKTLGYLAPASLWAERNRASVWISTYTRSLQHQIADELTRLYPDRREGARRVVVRKGRENYLCLLNLEEALGRMPGAPAQATGLGLMARWAAQSNDGDLTGNNFPSWLSELVGGRLTMGLADRRGECIHSACPHYNKCFVEKSVRMARHADIVIANHALVMIQAATQGDTDRGRPLRFIFDEGHHIFDAADSAFSATLTGIETAELRQWLRGAEDGRRGRARGLQKRLSDLLADDAQALGALEAAVEAARLLPGTGWRKRISENSPAGPAEQFLAAVRTLVYDRAGNVHAPYSLQSELHPVPEQLTAAGQELGAGLARLSEPLMQLAASVERLLADKADELDTQTRSRLEGAARGLKLRATGPLAAWQTMLSDLKHDGRDGFVDWLEVNRTEAVDNDAGLYRYWLDPMIPFAANVLDGADGVAVTSATLCDASPADSDNGTDPWASARLISGAGHLAHPALVSAHKSPFDYEKQARIFVVTDLGRERTEAVAAAMAGLITAADGGALGLFTSIQRLKQVHPELLHRLSAAGIPLFAQHIDKMSLQTLLQMFREDVGSALIGTDAVRDGVDVPGPALRMMIYERVPWPRPDMLFKARAAWQGRDAWTDRMTRMRLRQAFGRLIRRADDRGVFVMLDNRLPTRLTSAFPPEAEVVRTGLADAIARSREFLKRD